MEKNIPYQLNYLNQLLIKEENAFHAVMSGHVKDLTHLIKNYEINTLSLSGCIEMLCHAPTNPDIIDCLLLGLSHPHKIVKEGSIYGSLSHLHNNIIRVKLISLYNNPDLKELISDILNEYWLYKNTKFTYSIKNMKIYYKFTNITNILFSLLFGIILIFSMIGYLI